MQAANYDYIIVGGGIIGLSFAYHLIREGRSVLLLEKDSPPVSASVRNFGQIVPSGFGPTFQKFGRRSTEIYLQLRDDAGLPVRQQGSIYIASDEEEGQLLIEMNHLNVKNGYYSDILTPEDCLDIYPDLHPEYAHAALFYPSEIQVDPVATNAALLKYLQSYQNFQYRPDQAVVKVRSNRFGVHGKTSSGFRFSGDKMLICNGSDYQLLYPGEFDNDDLSLVKLQMLEVSTSTQVTIPGSVLTGWSIRRYECFENCPSYTAIKAQEDKSNYQHQNGVHILFKQKENGNIIIGDSHHYANIADRSKLGYELDQALNDFMLSEALKIFSLPGVKVVKSWAGFYSQMKDKPYFYKEVDENIHIITAIGGKGMTASFGFTEHLLETKINI